MENDQAKKQTFRLGDKVKILTGPFNGFRGQIEGINAARSLLKVKLLIYGRDEPVRVNYADVETLSSN